jgi:hypothetical protein
MGSGVAGACCYGAGVRLEEWPERFPREQLVRCLGVLESGVVRCGVESRKVEAAEQFAAADRAAMTAFRAFMPNPAARLLSFGVRRRRDHEHSRPLATGNHYYDREGSRGASPGLVAGICRHETQQA